MTYTVITKNGDLEFTYTHSMDKRFIRYIDTDETRIRLDTLERLGNANNYDLETMANMLLQAVGHMDQLSQDWLRPQS